MYVLGQSLGRKNAMRRLSVAALEQLWGATQLCGGLPVAQLQQRVRSLKLDLTALAFICSGNDYLPGMRGFRLDVRIVKSLVWEGVGWIHVWELVYVWRCRGWE